MFEFKLPDLGEGIHEGELLKWYVNVGDIIEEDASLADVETDKAAVTIPSPRGGKVVKLNGKVGDTLHTGEVIVVIDDGSGESKAEVGTSSSKEAESTPAAAEPQVAKKTAADTPAAKPSAPAPVASVKPADGRPVPAAPATRKLARELGVDINQVPGTGPGGRVQPDDVKAFASGDMQPVTQASVEAEGSVESTPPKEFASSAIPFFEVEQLPEFENEGPVEREALRSIRRKVARKMTTSMILVPHVAHMDEADVTELESFRTKFRQSSANSEDPGRSRLTLLPLVMKAVASLLKDWPMFNASLDPHREELVYKKYYNLGFAADTPRGLIVPVVKDADRKSIVQISSEIFDHAMKGRDGKIDVADLQQGTFTITNIGPIGGTGLIPTINYPEVAILGMGRVQEKPVVRDGEIVIRKILPLTLAFDHRVADGAQAARFVTELIRRLEDPNILLMES